MNFLFKVEGYRRFRDCIGGFERCTPEYFERTLLYFRQHFLQSVQSGYGNVLVQPGYDACCAAGYYGLCKAGDAEFAAFAVDMSVNQPGNQVLSGRIDDFCLRSHIVFDIPDGRNHILVDSNICGIDFACHDINQEASSKGNICRNDPSSCTNHFF